MFKLIKYFIFKLIYGKINKAIKPKDSKQIIVKKVIFNNLISYDLYIIFKGRLYTDTTNNTAFILNQFIIRDVSFQYKLKKNLQIVNGNIFDNFVVKNGTPKLIKEIKGSVFSLLSGGAAKNNYWHWMFDVLPKFGILEKSNFKLKPDYYLLPSLSQKYQLETLLSLRIPLIKLLDGEKQKHIFCDKFLAVDHPNVFNNNPSKSIQNIPVWIIKWLRKKYIKNNSSHVNLPEKIFINREEDSVLEKRKIINNKEVENLLTEHGFKSLTLSNYDFKKQVELFKNAKFIVGLHGAGFANIIFSNPGTKVLELQSKHSGKVILNLAKKCKMNYKRIIDSRATSIKHQNNHVKVDLQKLKKLIFTFK
tara:strand:- start:587 stop:1675 length:1089 start_codon:yes stop_codon:yes gene_type:complete